MANAKAMRRSPDMLVFARLGTTYGTRFEESRITVDCQRIKPYFQPSQ